MKCEADRRGTLRGRRQIMLDDPDVHHHRHSKAAVGGVAAAAIGDPGRVRVGRRDASGPARRRPGDRHRRRRRMTGGTRLAIHLPRPAADSRTLGKPGESAMTQRSRDRPPPCAGGCCRNDGARDGPPPPQDKVQDKVKVGVFPVSSSLPYFVALERGFFKEQNIEPETMRLIGGPPNVARHDHQPDRRLPRLLVTHRRHERRPEEARRRHVHCRSTARTRPTRWSSSSSARAIRRARSRTSRAPRSCRRPDRPT